MLKSLAGLYEPSRRSDHWLKLKRCGQGPADAAVLVKYCASARQVGLPLQLCSAQCTYSMLDRQVTRQRVVSCRSWSASDFVLIRRPS